MSQTAKVQEPSMEEILASIRRIIADDDNRPKAPEPVAAKAEPPPPPRAVAPPPPPAPRAVAPPPPPAANNQEDIDAMLAELDAPPKIAAKPAPAPAANPPPKPAAPPTDVLDLTEAMTAPAPAPSFRTIDGGNDVVFADPSEQRPEPPRAEPRRQVAPPPAPDQGLISNATVSAVDSAFNTLAYTVIGQNARTLEDLVKEMLRPLLKSWLDDNLPGMVERIVRAEIERVSRGGRQ